MPHHIILLLILACYNMCINSEDLQYGCHLKALHFPKTDNLIQTIDSRINVQESYQWIILAAASVQHTRFQSQKNQKHGPEFLLKKRPFGEVVSGVSFNVVAFIVNRAKSKHPTSVF